MARVGVAVVIAAALGTAPPSRPLPSLAAGVSAVAAGGHAFLANSYVRRAWTYGASPAGLRTTELSDLTTGAQWSAGGDDVNVTVNGQVVDGSAWDIAAVTATPAADASRPNNSGGEQVVFRLTPALGSALPPGLTLTRTYTLYPDSPTIEVDASLASALAAIQVKAYSLDQLTSAVASAAEVQAYVGGSDWRSDFRTTTVEAGSFDAEGEVLRTESVAVPGSGWFHVAVRRGGIMSRAARDGNGRTSVGVDDARDLYDLGPLASTPPNYNREPNPAYPAGGRFRTIPPGGTLHLGAALTGVYHGGPGEAAAAFGADFIAHAMPPFSRDLSLNSFHPWGHGSGLSDTATGDPGHGVPPYNMRKQAAAGLALGLESFMLDDQWQGASSGDWNFDPNRFPINSSGYPDFFAYLASNGLARALWMSPVEFNPGSQTYAAHRDWACAPVGDVTAQIQDAAGLGVWDINNSQFRAYLASVIDRAITQWGVREFKFDFQVWVDCGPASDSGLAHDYLDYEDNFVAFVRQLERDHPSVSFELDETNDQRAWPFESAALGSSWFDNGHTSGNGLPAGLTYVGKELHDVWSATPWLPPSSVGFGQYDGFLQPPYTAAYLMPLGLLSHFTFWTDLTKLSPADITETAWWTAWYKQHRAGLSGFAYEDTVDGANADPADGKSPMAIQPWTADHGYLFAFRQSGAAAAVHVALQGLQPGEQYHLTDVRSGADLGQASGAALTTGLIVTLPATYTSRVIEIDPVAPAAQAPEAPLAALVAGAGLAAVGLSSSLARRRRKG